ncbi:MAG: histidine phosphatase family protein [Gammaproteobacteria bacterium]|nr:histidine phosphatase family protein [Gammaproteobacteria bacterium]
MNKAMMRVTAVLISLFVATQAFADDKLVFAIDIIRHGDRTPIVELPNASYTWQQGLGRLTEEGMQQEYNLGVKMRAKYVDLYHLLPARYADEAMYVRSTNVDRTLMSAQSLLYGLYPLGVGAATLPSAFQPIPIHTIKKEEEILLIPDQDEKKFDALLHRYVYSQPEWKKKTSELHDKFRYWTELTGLKIGSLRDLVLLGDNLFVREHYQVALPAGITEEDAQDIISTSKWAFSQLFYPREVGEATAGALLTEIKQHLKEATDAKNKLKYVLYSAHDSTIMMVMSALAVPVAEWPHYASDLNFELFETPTNQYYVKISLNDEPVVVPACHADTCSLAQFMQLVKSIRS